MSFAASWYFLPCLAICAFLLSAGPVRPPPSRGVIVQLTRRKLLLELLLQSFSEVGGDAPASYPPEDLADDLDTHAPGGAFDLAHRGVDVVGVEVGHLDARDLADLVAGHAPDGLAPGRHRALLYPGRLAQQVSRGRGLEDERERPVLEDRDLGRDDLAGLVGRLLVVGLGELDDVDAVRTERGADGRGGGRLAGRQLQGQDDADLLGHGGAGSFLSQ